MPSAPRGKGGGKGKGELTNKEKACPIARPSRDYQWKIQQRDYGDDVKEDREETRRLEAEARSKARELGEKVDLGAAGAYWEKVADTQKKTKSSTPFTDRPRAWEPPTNAWASKPEYVAKPAASGSSPWANWGVQAKASDVIADPWLGLEQDNPSASSKDGKGWQKPSSTNSGWSNGWSSEPAQRDNAWTSNGWESSSAAPASRFPPSRTAPGAERSERSYTAEDKAKRAELRKAEMLARMKGQDAPEPIAGLPVRSAYSGAGAGYAAPAAQSAHPAEVPGRAEAGQWIDSIDLASRGLTDDALEGHCKQALASFPSHGLRRVKVVDLSKNKLTRNGFSLLVDFLCREGVAAEQLRLDGNSELLLDKEVTEVLMKLMSHSSAGFQGGFRELHLQTAQISQPCCWRLCEVCKKYAPSPAFRLCLHATSWQTPDERKKRIEELLQVFKTAMTFGVKIRGIDTLAEACGEPVPEGSSVNEAEASLIVDLVGDPVGLGIYQ